MRQTVTLNPAITILAGRNNVGKSALLRALRIPAAAQEGVGTDFEMSFVWRLGTDEILQIMNLPDAPWADRLKTAFRTKDSHEMRATFVSPARPLVITDLPRTTRGVIFAPGLVAGAQWMGLEFPEIGTALGWMAVQSGNQSTMYWLSGPLAADAEALGAPDPGLNGCYQLIAQLGQRISYIEPHRSGPSRPEFQLQPVLAPDGSNLTNVVATLYVDGATKPNSAFSKLQEFIKSAFPEITQIEVPMTPNPSPVTRPPFAEIFLGYGDLSVPLRLCGTGIEQLLVLGAGILTASSNRLFLLDEPHAFLHPSAERSLLSFLEDHTEHQYIVATHSGVFLNALPIGQSRLITMGSTGSTVITVETPGRILEEVGLTAADLWSADAILWVEGTSEEAVSELLSARLPRLRRRGVRIKAMPGTSRFGSASEKTARAAFEFCQKVSEALAPMAVRMSFLFDADEKTEDLKERIRQTSGGRAQFLEVRELENLFLRPRCIYAAIVERCQQLEIAAPSVEDVETELLTQLGNVTDDKLYRQKDPPLAADPTLVAGSEVLSRMYWAFSRSPYDKIADGKRLAELILEEDPEGLAPLANALQHLAN
ncbi:MAG: AAA family ATPase [Candidatus Dormibacteraeota bacterium]|nr:AAA family ATPase [Candidatus Dormibacteraeota bacterium]